MAEPQESVRLPRDVMAVVRQISEQSGRSLIEVMTRAVMSYSASYMDGMAAGGRVFMREIGDLPREK